MIVKVTVRKALLFSVLALAFGQMAEAGGIKTAGAADAPAAGSAAGGKVAPIAEAGAKKVEVTEASFRCLHQMTKVGDVYVDNLLGQLDATKAVASSAAGGIYPPGSVLQLIPGEAMVKLDKGARPETSDWEFFALDVQPEGVKIKQRGSKEVSNMFGSCFNCHANAAPQRDLVCGKGNGCPPVVFPDGIDNAKLTAALQKTDKRCPSPEPPKPEELAELKKLLEWLASQAGQQ
ncbi:MAG: hypothetical protein ACTFAK_16630 [Candidatus Electronema sp. VV]